MHSRTTLRTKRSSVPLAPLTAIVVIVVLLGPVLGPLPIGQRSPAMEQGNDKESRVATTLFGFTPFPYDLTLEALAKRTNSLRRTPLSTPCTLTTAFRGKKHWPILHSRRECREAGMIRHGAFLRGTRSTSALLRWTKTVRAWLLQGESRTGLRRPWNFATHRSTIPRSSWPT